VSTSLREIAVDHRRTHIETKERGERNQTRKKTKGCQRTSRPPVWFLAEPKASALRKIRNLFGEESSLPIRLHQGTSKSHGVATWTTIGERSSRLAGRKKSMDRPKGELRRQMGVTQKLGTQPFSCKIPNMEGTERRIHAIAKTRERGKKKTLA